MYGLIIAAAFMAAPDFDVKLQKAHRLSLVCDLCRFPIQEEIDDNLKFLYARKQYLYNQLAWDVKRSETIHSLMNRCSADIDAWTNLYNAHLSFNYILGNKD